MKIYFSGSIKGGREDKEIYFEIINILKKYGEILTEYVGDQNLSSYGQKNFTDEQIYEKDTQWLKIADVIVAEVTTPSLGVGYEIAFAESLGKKILCLYRENGSKSLSSMIKGDKNLDVKTYKEVKDLEIVFQEFFK